MKTRTKKSFDIVRVREFCKLVNEGKSPNQALIKMNTCTNYRIPLENAGIFYKEKDGTYKAVERIFLDRYELFLEEKTKYRKYRTEIAIANKKKKEERVNTISKRNSYKEYNKQASLFNQPKTTNTAPTMKAKERQLNFIQRVAKSLFNL